jgi:hypothetical protein
MSVPISDSRLGVSYKREMICLIDRTSAAEVNVTLISPPPNVVDYLTQNRASGMEYDNNVYQ